MADANRDIVLEKVKLGKFSTEFEKLLGNGGNLKQREMHHCLRGDGRMDTSVSMKSRESRLRSALKRILEEYVSMTLKHRNVKR